VIWSEGLFLRTRHFPRRSVQQEWIGLAGLGARRGAGGQLPTFRLQQLDDDSRWLDAGGSIVSAPGACFRTGHRPFSFPPGAYGRAKSLIAGSSPTPEPGWCWSRCRSRPPGGVGWSIRASNKMQASDRARALSRQRSKIVSRVARTTSQRRCRPRREIDIGRPQALLLEPGKSVGGYTGLADRPNHQRAYAPTAAFRSTRRSAARRGGGGGGGLAHRAVHWLPGHCAGGRECLDQIAGRRMHKGW